MNYAIIWLSLAGMFLYSTFVEAEEPQLKETTSFRKPTDEADLQYWLKNMVWFHGFSNKEVSQATGLTECEVQSALKKWKLDSKTEWKYNAGSPLMTIPYPGGRHPRIGFLDGAIAPQRETKFSVFAPWDNSAYVVVDLPEAIWSNHGLTYLAHTHIDTVWTKRGIKLKPMEWERLKNGVLKLKRKLPNGLTYEAKVVPGPKGVKMELSLHNGTSETLSDLRIQNCVMLKKLPGFNEQTNDNKLKQTPFIAAHSANKKRWVITTWTHPNHIWANEKCPCIHTDPKFPDLKPGEKYSLKGWLSFYEGEDIQAEFKRIKKLKWLAN